MKRNLMAFGLAALLAACGADPTPTTSTTDDQALSGADDEALDPTSPVVGGPANGHCADAQAELVYEASRKQGGARPLPEHVVAQQKLTYRNALVGETLRRASGASEDVHPWEVTLRFVEGTKVSLESTGDPRSGSATYAQKVKGTLVHGLGPSIAHNTFETFVICRSSWAMMP